MGTARLFGARVVHFDRAFDEAYALDPGRVADAITHRTRLIIITSPHNPSGALARQDQLEEVGRIADAQGALVVVDEVYLDTVGGTLPTAARLGDTFLVTSSLTKSYGLAGLRCGWILSWPAIAVRLRRARVLVDGSGSIVAERLCVLAFELLDALLARARTLLATNLALTLEFLRGRPELRFVEPGGGTVVFPRLEPVDDATPFVERLAHDYVTAVEPGRFFQAPRHFRLGFSGETTALRGGLDAIGTALDRG
jgi:aspartate/methionine/tyrosine aminotransferase